MKGSFISIKLFLIYSSIFASIIAEEPLDNLCQDWASYQNEKCYKIIKSNTYDFEEAKSVCQNQKNSTLAVIETADEQDFLSSIIFNNSQVIENVWIGLKRNKNNGRFEWIDGTELRYENWQQGQPVNKPGKDCVNLVPDDGFWANYYCTKKNAIVCQRLPNISPDEVPIMIIKMQRKLKEQEMRIKDQEYRLKNQDDKIRNQDNKIKGQDWRILNQTLKIEDQETRTRELEQQIEGIKNSTNKGLPIGFIYTQLPHQPEPEDLFRYTQWEEVSSLYAGLFFRTVGADAAPFEYIQNDASPRITEIASRWMKGEDFDNETTGMTSTDWYTTRLPRTTAPTRATPNPNRTTATYKTSTTQSPKTTKPRSTTKPTPTLTPPPTQPPIYQQNFRLMRETADGVSWWSESIFTGKYGNKQDSSNRYSRAIRFKTSMSEVRPKNTAVRIWKRVK